MASHGIAWHGIVFYRISWSSCKQHGWRCSLKYLPLYVIVALPLYRHRHLDLAPGGHGSGHQTFICPITLTSFCFYCIPGLLYKPVLGPVPIGPFSPCLLIQDIEPRRARSHLRPKFYVPSSCLPCASAAFSPLPYFLLSFSLLQPGVSSYAHRLFFILSMDGETCHVMSRTGAPRPAGAGSIADDTAIHALSTITQLRNARIPLHHPHPHPHPRFHSHSLRQHQHQHQHSPDLCSTDCT